MKLSFLPNQINTNPGCSQLGLFYSKTFRCQKRIFSICGPLNISDIDTIHTPIIHSIPHRNLVSKFRKVMAMTSSKIH